MLSRESILQSDDLARVEVQVPEWGGSVYVRTMTGGERDAFEAAVIGANGKASNLVNVRARLAVLCCCDGQGQRLFADDDCSAVAAKSAAALQRIFDVARKLNALSKDDVEELEKN